MFARFFIRDSLLRHPERFSRHPEQREDSLEGECRSHACMGMTEPKGRDIVPSRAVALMYANCLKRVLDFCCALAARRSAFVPCNTMQEAA